MNEIANYLGIVVAMAALKTAPAPQPKTADELMMDRLMSAIKPDFAITHSDLTDHSFSK